MTTKCPSCGHHSQTPYRCERCGRDLAGDTTTHGRQGGSVE